MITDILTLIWKERKALLRPQGGRFQSGMMWLTPALLAILLPLQIGEAFLSTAFVLILTFIVPIVIIAVTIPNSFAGERERHTLETLLASRLPDRAILFGKLVLPVLFAWTVLGIAQILALVVFNVAYWNGSLQVHPPTLLLGIIGLGLMLPLVAAEIGVFISLRAATVQSATQALFMVLFVPIIVLQIVGAVVIGTGRDRIQRILDTLEILNWTVVLILLLAGLLIATVLLLLAVMARFQRARLILNG